MNRGRIIKIGLVVLVLAGIAGVLYWTMFAQKKPEESASDQPRLVKLLDERVVSPIPSFDNSAIWYFNQNGKLFRISLDGTGMTEFPLPEFTDSLRSVLWAKNGSDFILIGDRVATQGEFIFERKSYFNSESDIYVALADNVLSLDWMPDGKRVVYVWKSGDNIHQSLVLANADGSGFRTISELFWPDLKVKVSGDGHSVLLYRGRLAEAVNKIYLADIETGQISTLVEEGKNIEAEWISPSKFIYSQRDETTGFQNLFSYDIASKASLNLQLSTSINKITVDSTGKFLYAAVPKTDNLSDQFIRLDLGNLKQEVYFDPQETIRATNLILVGNTLYFVDGREGKLYKIEK